MTSPIRVNGIFGQHTDRPFTLYFRPFVGNKCPTPRGSDESICALLMIKLVGPGGTLDSLQEPGGVSVSWTSMLARGRFGYFVYREIGCGAMSQTAKIAVRRPGIRVHQKQKFVFLVYSYAANTA